LLSHHTWNEKRCGINKELSMIIKINYNKSTKQITLSNDIENNLLSLIDSKKIDTDDELSFEISVDTSFFQEENDSYEEEE
tara:strand:- start:574 stop:816 length:243 start_codon:yes stop_codon:yes gene_type:complete